MAVYYYGILFIISYLLSIFYVYIWQKRFNLIITSLFILIPLVNLMYYIMYSADVIDVESATVALKLIYVGGCFLPWFITIAVMNLCGIELYRWVRFVSFMINSLLYGFVLTIGHFPYFYKDLKVTYDGDTPVLVKEYGFVHTIFYIVIAMYFLVSIAVIIYSYFKKKQVSGRIIFMLFLPHALAIIGYLCNNILGNNIELMPLIYTIAQIVYLFIVHRMALYDVSDMVIESMVQSGDTGFISFDFKYNYLGSNDTAKKILPVLNDLVVDHSIEGLGELKNNVYKWIDHFKENDSATKSLYTFHDEEGKNEDRIYIVTVNYLYDGRRRRGYQIFLEDDTQNQKYIKLLDKYNSELQDEVAKKTSRIVEMHDNLIISMATMVESRDNSTGGHIKRTSENVKILINSIKGDGVYDFSDSFCRNLIKAAPMHDLGKIAVDDALLKKPGRFTDEEFEQMKQHAAEGARIVHEILKDTDDEDFKKVAENVAHFHHERWDGSGYPKGLKGKEIPIEARIMAIADVYDALVSKRVYKASMSFSQADRIIMEGMGTQFDPELEKCYVHARPWLEAYYSSLES